VEVRFRFDHRLSVVRSKPRVVRLKPVVDVIAFEEPRCPMQTGVAVIDVGVPVYVFHRVSHVPDPEATEQPTG